MALAAKCKKVVDGALWITPVSLLRIVMVMNNELLAAPALLASVFVKLQPIYPETIETGPFGSSVYLRPHCGICRVLRSPFFQNGFPVPSMEFPAGLSFPLKRTFRAVAFLRSCRFAASAN
ncbi:MAG: hypothetical protein E6Q98_20715 [Rhodospirillaceae bacterium]|nr:MAG: hypothetical protein E6Q98_20715 [Rhodospirillaceae bacterium]